MIAKVTLRNLGAHKLRLALTALSVILGVAFVAGTLIFTDTMTKSFDDVFSDVGKNTSVEVRGRAVVGDNGDDGSGSDVPVSQQVVDSLKTVPGVATVRPSVSGFTAVVGKDGKLLGGGGPPQFGTNWIEGGDDTIATGRPPAKAGEVVIDSATAENGGFKVGDTVKLAVQGPAQTATIVGLLESKFGNVGVSITAFDTATAQKLLLKPGFYSGVSLTKTGDVSETELAKRVQAALPANLEAVTGEQVREDARSDVDAFLSIFRNILLAFALVSIFVGAFIIFNTFSMLVAQRTRELALLRAVGAARSQVTRAVLGEAVAVGFLGSTVGLGVGVGLALILKSFSGMEGSLAFTPTPVIAAYLVGILVTVAAAYFPARRASKIPPVAAMRDDIALPQRSLRVRALIGTVVAVLGAALIGLGLAGVGDQELYLLGAGVLGVFLGVTMLAPVISRPLVRILAAPFPRLFGTPGRLARENPQRNPRRTAATAAALMIGLSLVTMVNVVSTSIQASIEQLVDEQFGTDYAVSVESGPGLDESAITAVKNTPGVTEAIPLYYAEFRATAKNYGVVAGDAPALLEAARAKLLSGTADAGTDGILVNEDIAKDKGWGLGSTVQATFPNGDKQTLKVKGVFSKNEFLSDRVLSLAAYKAHTDRPEIEVIAINTSEQSAATRKAIENSISAYPGAIIQDKADLKQQVQDQLNGFVLFVTVMLALSIIIAVVGVINTLALSVIERTRELGLLRAVGASRRQVRRMIRLESVVIAVFGALLGIALGVGFGVAIQRAAKDEIQLLSIPYGTLVFYLVLAAVIGVLAALWPAWRAGRMNVLRAIATD